MNASGELAQLAQRLFELVLGVAEQAEPVKPTSEVPL
jgi:hypothetical protein